MVRFPDCLSLSASGFSRVVAGSGEPCALRGCCAPGHVQTASARVALRINESVYSVQDGAWLLGRTLWTATLAFLHTLSVSVASYLCNKEHELEWPSPGASWWVKRHLNCSSRAITLENSHLIFSIVSDLSATSNSYSV